VTKKENKKDNDITRPGHSVPKQGQPAVRALKNHEILKSRCPSRM